MPEKPILFSGPMVRALREKRKTQTRRLAKPQLMAGEKISPHPSGDGSFLLERWPEAGRSMMNFGRCEVVKPPYQPGDVLWVRECFQVFGPELDGEIGYPLKYIPGSKENYAVLYAASGDEGPWRPSIHMPRWASRITLRVTAVRAERLLEISEEDARAEGVDPWPWNPDQSLTTGERAGDSPYRAGYALLWDELNDDRATWKSNPLVWVYTFEEITNATN